MLEITNCPNSGLVRKLDYQFFWLKLNRKIIIQCHVSHYKRDQELYEAYQVALSAHTQNPTGTTMPVQNYDTKIENLAIKTFAKELVASDTLVNPATGVILTQDQQGQNQPAPLNSDGKGISQVPPEGVNIPEPSAEDLKKYDLELQNYESEQDAEDIDYSSIE
jgi:hypothetical protein